MRKCFCFVLLVVSIPVLVINFFYSFKILKISSGFIENKKDIKKENKTSIRVLREDNSINTIDLEEYLVGVLSAEVPVYFEEEALKAQAVASRTYALKQIQNNSNNSYDVTDNVLTQVYYSEEQLKERWQENYESNINKIKKAINDTNGEYLTYNDDIIYAFFFSTSNGMTEDNKNVFGMDLEYLKPVDSSFDEEETDNFITVKSFSTEEFFNKLNLDYSNDIEISNIDKSESGRVLYLSINGVPFKGRTFQKLLELRSNDFEIEITGDTVKITTKGFGHGVGMSQYGANALAKKNKSYIEILKYYYKGVELKKL